MIWNKKQISLFSFVILIAAALRLPLLDGRPMHTDEAVHAIKFGTLLEEKKYEYNPFEYHGPTLNYATLVSAKLQNIATLQQTDETLLRLIPVVFSFILLFFLPGLKSKLTASAILWIATLTTISPSMIFFSRYYIQEMLLISFTFAAIVCGFNWFKKRRWRDAGALGFCLGLMHATKETAIIAWGAMGMAALACWFMMPTFKETLKTFPKQQWLAVIVTAIGTSALFYSSFFTNSQGIFDSVQTYFVYFDRAAAPDGHHEPWFYYFWILIRTEWWILIAGFIGLIVVIQKIRTKQITGLLLFWTIYTLVLTIIYSLLPYKTPWSMLGFWHGWILLAGWSINEGFKHFKQSKFKIAILILIGLGCGHAIYQSVLNLGSRGSAPSNPLTYSHPRAEVKEIATLIEQIAQVQPEQDELVIEVISPALDYWPLPWYLRRFKNVGWWQEVNMTAPSAPIILIHPDFKQALVQKLYSQPPPGQRHLYLPLVDHDISMRPGVYLKGYIRKDVWDHYLQETI